jgi:hypothetical protein
MTTQPPFAPASPPPSPRYGATHDEWRLWAFLAGADLLPAVAPDPCLGSAPRSPRLARLPFEQLAKTPSHVGRDGTIYGVAGWVQHRATPDAVKEWATAGLYNVLMVCRTIRAIDIDIPSAEHAEQLVAALTRALDVGPLPVRSRANSGKRTILLQINRTLPLLKRVVKTPWGPVEFLADRQQTVVAGTHPSGVRFELAGLTPGHPIPTVDFSRLCDTWGRLIQLYDPQAAPLYDPEAAQVEYARRERGQQGTDPVADWLEGEGWVHSYEANGTINVRCPWESEHTSASGPNSTSWLPAGLGGRPVGGFRCLHAHCEHRHTEEFLGAIGYTQAVIVERFSNGLAVHPAGPPAQQAVQQAPDARAGATQDAVQVGVVDHDKAAAEIAAAADRGLWLASRGLTYRKSGDGKVLPILENKIIALMGAHEIIGARQDDFTGRTYVRYGQEPYHVYTDDDATMVRRLLEGTFNRACSKADAADALRMLANAYRYDAAQEALQAIVPEWDGVPRISAFGAKILKMDPNAYAEALGWYIHVAIVGRVLSPGAKADIVPVLWSPQGTGKSTLVRALPLLDDWFGELSLEEKDADLARRVVGRVVLEWAELKGSAGRPAESTKAFLSSSHDEWVPKYQEAARRMLRRFLVVGTSNKPQHLHDPTGNRRYASARVALTAPFVDHMTYSKDRAQYWAEARAAITAAPTVLDCIEEHATRLRKLAEPYVAAATLPWHRAQDLRNIMHNIAPGTPVRLADLAPKLFGASAYMNRALAHELRDAMHQEGYEQLAADVWLARPPDSGALRL